MNPTLQVVVATLITSALSVLWLRLNDFMAARGMITGQLSRKLIHTGTGPIFVLCWLLFPDHPASRFAATIIPLLITAKFALVGLGAIQDQAEIDSLTRHGDRREILRGPLYYGIAFVIITLLYWTDSIIGVVALMMLCGGDGMADIVGRRLKTLKLPWSAGKTVAGSIAMFAGGAGLALFVVFWFIQTGKFAGTLGDYAAGILIIGLVCTIVESLPLQEYDNITVTGAALLLGHIIF